MLQSHSDKPSHQLETHCDQCWSRPTAVRVEAYSTKHDCRKMLIKPCSWIFSDPIFASVSANERDRHFVGFVVNSCQGHRAPGALFMMTHRSRGRNRCPFPHQERSAQACPTSSSHSFGTRTSSKSGADGCRNQGWPAALSDQHLHITRRVHPNSAARMAVQRETPCHCDT